MVESETEGAGAESERQREWAEVSGQKSEISGQKKGGGLNEPSPDGFNNGWNVRSARSPTQSRQRVLRASALSNPLVVRCH